MEDYYELLLYYTLFQPINKAVSELFASKVLTGPDFFTILLVRPLARVSGRNGRHNTGGSVIHPKDFSVSVSVPLVLELAKGLVAKPLGPLSFQEGDLGSLGYSFYARVPHKPFRSSITFTRE